jgi:hypothetical protein
LIAVVARCLAQIKLVGSNFLEVLHSEIAPDNLPAEYGGTSTQPYLPACTLTEAEVRARAGFESFVLAVSAEAPPLPTQGLNRPQPVRQAVGTAKR